MTTKPRLLGREVLEIDDRATEIVDVPEWNGSVKIRALSGLERGQYESSMMKYRRTEQGGVELEAVDTDNLRARLVALSVVDDEGNRVFRESDVLALGDKSAAPLDRIFRVAQKLSHLTQEDVEALKTGLKAGPNGSSGSGSPEISG